MPGYVEFNTPFRINFAKTLPEPSSDYLAGVPQIKCFTMKSIFSDNSRVCYKPGSFGGGVGTVVNRASKKNRT